MNKNFLKTMSVALASLILNSVAQASVSVVAVKAVQMLAQDGMKIQIQFRGETISTSGSSVANTSAEAIQIKAENCEASSMTAKLRGVTTDGADVIQIVKLQKIGACLFVGTPVYSLSIATIDTGKLTLKTQSLEIENAGQVMKFDFILGQE